ASSALASLLRDRIASRTLLISRRLSVFARRSGTSESEAGRLASSFGGSFGRSSLRSRLSIPGVPSHIQRSMIAGHCAIQRHRLGGVGTGPKRHSRMVLEGFDAY